MKIKTPSITKMLGAVPPFPNYTVWIEYYIIDFIYQNILKTCSSND